MISMPHCLNIITWDALEAIQLSFCESLLRTTIYHVKTMDVSNPRRILALGAPDAGVLSLLKGTFTSQRYALSLMLMSTAKI
jgi:hypothetical protein